MTDITNPVGSESQEPQGSTIADAANSFLGLLDPEEAPIGQADEGQEPEAELQGEEEPAEVQEDGEANEESDSKYRIKVGGEEQELTYDELVNLAQQGADYTKKTQQVAEQRKAVEAERQAVEEAKYMRDAYAERLQAIEQLLAGQMQSEDIESLKDSDPIGYAVKVAERQQYKEQMAAVQAEQQRIAYQQQAEQQQQLQSYLTQQAEVLSRSLPDYVDPVKGESLRSDLRSFAKSIGFTDGELSQVRDARQVMALYKAMQYDKLQQSKPQVQKRVSEAPKNVKSGNSREEVSSDVIKRQKQQLQQSGRVRDAAAIWENFL